jgi:endonuclease/exonuclease/phosphatase family metal-dependent hydrolase
MAKAKHRQKSDRVNPVNNDNLSRYLRDFIPDELEGNDRFLDLITWNIKFFNNRDPKRVDNIKSIIQELNADIFVLQEIEFGSLDEVAESLTKAGAGLYKVAYGTTGGDQRVAFMYDMEWVKASINVEELFTDNPTVMANGMSKPIFPRLPLYSTFVARSIDKEEDPFDFQLVGVHLKSQRGGGSEQRTEAAKFLAEWVKTKTTDEDIIIAGDWNAQTDRPEWESIRQLEAEGKIKFKGWNTVDNDSEASHLSVSGRRSRLDLIVISETIQPADGEQEAKVINWNALFESKNSPRLLKDIIDNISDHLPVVTRFYFTDKDE